MACVYYGCIIIALLNGTLYRRIGLLSFLLMFCFLPILAHLEF
jgi:hypothetical protein